MVVIVVLNKLINLNVFSVFIPNIVNTDRYNLRKQKHFGILNKF